MMCSQPMGGPGQPVRKKGFSIARGVSKLVLQKAFDPLEVGPFQMCLLEKDPFEVRP